MKLMQGIFRYAVAIAFLLVAITAPTATACNNCDFLCLDIPPGYVELALGLCVVTIKGTVTNLTVDGPSWEGCTAICDDCTNKNPTTGPPVIDWCVNSFPEANILTVCEDAFNWCMAPKEPIYKEPGRYYLKGGGGQVSVKCKYADVGCTGTKSYRNKTPITFHFVITISHRKVAYYGLPGADPEYDPDVERRERIVIETKSITQSSTWIHGQIDESICTDEQFSSCMWSSLITNCGSEN